MKDELKNLLLRFGWLDGLSITDVKMFIGFYDRCDVHGEVIDEKKFKRLVDSGWIEVVNFTEGGEDVYRPVPIKQLLSKFREDLNAFYADCDLLINGVYKFVRKELVDAETRQEVRQKMNGKRS